MDRILPLQLTRGGHQDAISARDRILPHFCSAGGEASTHERGGHQGKEKDRILPLRLSRGRHQGDFLSSFAVRGGRLRLARGTRLLSARQNSPPLLQCGGGGFRGRNQGAYSARVTEFSPSFSAPGGRLRLTRRRRLLSVLLPLFCSARGEALTRERAPSQRACGHQETTIKMGKHNQNGLSWRCSICGWAPRN